MKRALVALLLAAGCGKPAGAPSGPPAAALRKPKVTVTVATPVDVSYTVEAAGTLEAAEEVSIPARVSGVLDKVNFREGQAVTTETVLAEIDVERYELAVRRAKAELDRAAAHAELAQKQYANRRQLYDEGQKTNKQWVTEEQLATWRADVEKAKADVSRAQADLDLARRDAAYSRVRPPIAGTVNRKMVALGEYVKPETVLGTMIDTSRLYVRFTVPELDAARLAVDQDVFFTLRSAPSEKPYHAKIFYLSQKADPMTRAVEAKAEVTAPTGQFRAGLFVAVSVPTSLSKGIVIPERAALPTERGFIVYVLDGTRVHAKVVRLGLRTPQGIEVLQGLDPGATVVVDGAASLREGLEVEVVQTSLPQEPKTP